MSNKQFQVGSLDSRKQGEGVRKFRKPTSNGIQNKILYGILFAIDMDINQKEMKIKDFSEGVGISTRSIQRYIYEGDRPSDENIEKICDYLGYPERILFYDINHKL